MKLASYSISLYIIEVQYELENIQHLTFIIGNRPNLLLLLYCTCTLHTHWNNIGQ